MTRKPRTFLLSLLAFAVLALPSTAFGEEGSWNVRVFGARVDPSVDKELTTEDGSVINLGDDSAAGGGFALERRLSNRLGLELSLLTARPELTIRGLMFCEDDMLCDAAVDGAVRFSPLSAGLNFHLTPDRRADVYIGPMMAYIHYGNPDFTIEDQTEEVSIRDDWAFGVQLGVDVAMGSGPWSFHSGARFFDSAPKGNDDDDGPDEELSFDPLILVLGLGYRF